MSKLNYSLFILLIFALGACGFNISNPFEKNKFSVSIESSHAEIASYCAFEDISDPTNSVSQVSFKISFSEPITATSFTVADIVNKGTGGKTALTWNLTNCSGGKIFKLTATSIVGYGTIIPTLEAGSVEGVAGRTNLASTSQDNIITYSAVAAPLNVTINQASGLSSVGTCSFNDAEDPANNPSEVSFKITFSESINTTTFDSSDIINSGTASPVWSSLISCGDGKNFKLKASSVSGNGTLVPSLPANKVQSLAGNNNLASTSTDNSILYDTSAPTGTIAINAAATYATSTSVTLNLTSAGGATQMYVTNVAGCASGGSWEAVAATKAWTLGQSNMTATVYVAYKDGAENISSLNV